jgi:diaminopimelate epimerase
VSSTPAFTVWKGHGLGNDYLVVDRADLPFELTPARVRYLCDRHRGLGSDGILIADLSDGIALRIMNPDGTEAEKSGNGLRIFGAWLHGRGTVGTDWFDVRLTKDTVAMRVEEVLDHGVLMIRVEMGIAEFTAEAAGFTGLTGVAGEVPVDLPLGGSASINPVSLSNPHCVVFLDVLERTDFLARAPQLCTHPLFPKGTNVQFARIIDQHTVEAWIWERGAGETMASGSSASAVCAAAVHNDLLRPGTFEVRMEGGSVEVEVTANYAVKLRGPAQMIYRAQLDDGSLNEMADGLMG